MASPKKVPGHIGFPIIGDKSVEFYKDVIAFGNSRIKKHSGCRMFAQLFLNKPTVFVASNKGVEDLLNDEDSFEMGYKQYMSEIYGDNVLFQDGEEAQKLRSVLHQLLQSNESFSHFKSVVDRLTSSTIEKLDTKQPVEIYKVFKRLTTEICLTVFLDVDFETASELAERVVALTTTHWHGIISVPVNLKVPVLQSKSSFGHALEAKAELLKIITEKLQSGGFPQQMRDSAFDPDQAANHVLLFTSALVPKALASMLTSFVVHTANRKALLEVARSSEQELEYLLLELQRLWPPFAGGRRVAKKDVVLDGYLVPAGHSVVFLTPHAQRDPAAFPHDPDVFVPSRWAPKAGDRALGGGGGTVGTGGAGGADRSKLFLFGAGSRSCVGQHLVWHVLKAVSGRLLQSYSWDVTPGQSLQYKWLPVSRPKDKLTVMFQRRGGRKWVEDEGEKGEKRVEGEEGEVRCVNGVCTKSDTSLLSSSSASSYSTANESAETQL